MSASGLCAQVIAMGITSWQRRTTTAFEACEYYTLHHTFDPQNEVADVPTAAVQFVILKSGCSFLFFEIFCVLRYEHSTTCTKARVFQEFDFTQRCLTKTTCSMLRVLPVRRYRSNTTKVQIAMSPKLRDRSLDVCARCSLRCDTRRDSDGDICHLRRKSSLLWQLRQLCQHTLFLP